MSKIKTNSNSTSVVRKNYTYSQATAARPQRGDTEEATTQLPNQTQPQQTNNILELKNIMMGLMEKMDSMLNILTILVAKIPK